jgi:hypothetical protein
LAARIRKVELTEVVLQIPGPPVITSTLDISASRTAACWLSEKGRALSASIQWHLAEARTELQAIQSARLRRDLNNRAFSGIGKIVEFVLNVAIYSPPSCR